MSASPNEWNAVAYHQVSAPQTSWGERVLARLTLAGDERVIDAGCGSGRLTGSLAAKLPRGHLVAVDRSRNMLHVARTNLRPSFGSRVSFVQVALPALPFSAWADVVFSTATFHWIDDHPALFANIFAALAPGGRLHAQCGGGPNLAAARALAGQVMCLPRFARYFTDWDPPWLYANAVETAARLGGAGFVDVHTDLEEATTQLATADDYKAFVTTVIYHPHLARLPDALRGPFIDEVTSRAAATSPPFTLDYWRLNMTARRRR